MGGESEFPSEPGTAGLTTGPGPGPDALMASTPSQDLREIVLLYLMEQFGNQDVAKTLHELREERQPVPGPLSV